MQAFRAGTHKRTFLTYRSRRTDKVLVKELFGCIDPGLLEEPFGPTVLELIKEQFGGTPGLLKEHFRHRNHPEVFSSCISPPLGLVCEPECMAVLQSKPVRKALTGKIYFWV